MEITSIRTAGLGDTTYLLAHEGVALIVDPQRDVDRFEIAVADAGVRLTHVLETHLHNDYLSGGRQLAAHAGADLVFPAAAGAAFSHVPAFHLEDMNRGPFMIRPNGTRACSVDGRRRGVSILVPQDVLRRAPSLHQPQSP